MDPRRELARRLARLGMPFEGERLDAAERIVGMHAPHHATLSDLERRVAAGEIDPRPVSGGQELLENVVNQHIWAAARTPARV